MHGLRFSVNHQISRVSVPGSQGLSVCNHSACFGGASSILSILREPSILCSADLHLVLVQKVFVAFGLSSADLHFLLWVIVF